jgi:subtilisin family serine protease
MASVVALTPTLPSATPPVLREHHVRVPDQLAEILRADKAHLHGITGRGVKVAVIDSGFYPHPYYTTQDYKIEWIATPKDPEPASDVYGHGTAQLACLLSIAPDAHVFAIKCTDVDPSSAIEQAIALGAQIISCAWGFDIDQPDQKNRKKKLPKDMHALHRLIVEAIGKGICVVAAAGNGQFSFPGSMPEVISAGGAFYGEDQKFYPSDLSSVYESSIFQGRKIPDLCGLAGNLPHGRLLLLPVPPQAKLARRPGFQLENEAGPKKKTTGWALFSGTSAATAMISGAAALVLQRDPTLSPSDVKKRLIESSMQLEAPAGSFRVLDVESCFTIYEMQGAPL